MTQAQLNSMAKRINQNLVQHAKTFGVNSEAYKIYSDLIKTTFGEQFTHVSKSGHVAINTGVHLQHFEERLKNLDSVEHKVSTKKKYAANYLYAEYQREGGIQSYKKFTQSNQSKIIAKANDIAKIEDFFDNKLGDYYALRYVIDDVDNILRELSQKTGSRKSYDELFNIINQLEKIYEEYEGQQMTEEDVINERKRGKRL